MQYSVNVKTGKFTGGKPDFIHTQTLVFSVVLLNDDGTPFVLTGFRAQCALKQNFIHGPGQELIVYSLGTITAPETGVVAFSVECRSTLFYDAVKFGIATCYFEISLIPSGETDSIRVAFDTVTLKPRVQVDEGEPQQAGPEYYTAAQVESAMDNREFAPSGGEVGDVLTKTATGQAWAELPAGRVTSVNGQTGDVSITPENIGAVSTSGGTISGSLTLTGNLTTAGQQIVTLTSTTIAPQDNKVYKKVLEESDSFSFDTTALTAEHQVTFELHVIQPSTAVTFTLPNTIIWANGDSFAAGNSAPDMSTANTEYCLVFRWDGAQLLGNLAYSKEVSA